MIFMLVWLPWQTALSSDRDHRCKWIYSLMNKASPQKKKKRLTDLRQWLWQFSTVIGNDYCCTLSLAGSEHFKKGVSWKNMFAKPIRHRFEWSRIIWYLWVTSDRNINEIEYFILILIFLHTPATCSSLLWRCGGPVSVGRLQEGSPEPGPALLQEWQEAWGHTGHGGILCQVGTAYCSFLSPLGSNFYFRGGGGGATFHIPLTKSATLNTLLHCSLCNFQGPFFFLFSRDLFCIMGAKSPGAPV